MNEHKSPEEIKMAKINELLRKSETKKRHRPFLGNSRHDTYVHGCKTKIDENINK